MTRRPEAHPTDRQALLAFQSMVPAEWIVREKGQDYGIDLEVEIFEGDEPTGLSFHVQMKGTRSVGMERRVSILTDRLIYLLSFDVPSVVCRHCTTSGRLYWVWTVDAARQIVDDQAATVGLRFAQGDLWSERTPSEIKAVLMRLRRLRSASRSTPVDVVCDFEALPVRDRFLARAGVDDLVSLCRCLRHGRSGDEAQDAVTVLVAATTGELTVSIEPFARRKLPIGGVGHPNVASAVAYAMASLLAAGGLTDQARLLVSLALKQGWQVAERGAAADAAATLRDDPERVVDLAILNDLHAVEDIHYLAVPTMLLRSGTTGAATDVVCRFFEAAIARRADDEPDGIASVHYSLGNLRSNTGEFLAAARAFNVARKLDPSYLGRPYFCRELGSVLFRSGRFRSAARAYACAVDKDPDARTRICFGDALLYSGRLIEAREQYEAASASDDVVEHHEGMLKVELCLALASWAADPDVPPPVMSPDWHFWAPRIVLAQEEGRHADVVTATLMLAFFFEDDEELWFAALQSSVMCGSADRISWVLTSTLTRRGRSAYARLRSMLAEQMEERFIGMLDEFADAILSAVTARKTEPVLVRILGQEPSPGYLSPESKATRSA